MPVAQRVSFVLPDHYPPGTNEGFYHSTFQGALGGFWFADGVAVVDRAEAGQAEKLLCRYYGCSRHEGVYVHPSAPKVEAGHLPPDDVPNDIEPIADPHPGEDVVVEEAEVAEEPSPEPAKPKKAPARKTAPKPRRPRRTKTVEGASVKGLPKG